MFTTHDVAHSSLQEYAFDFIIKQLKQNGSISYANTAMNIKFMQAINNFKIFGISSISVLDLTIMVTCIFHIKGFIKMQTSFIRVPCVFFLCLFVTETMITILKQISVIYITVKITFVPCRNYCNKS